MFQGIKNFFSSITGKGLPSMKGILESVIGHGLVDTLAKKVDEHGEKIIKEVFFPDPPARDLLYSYIDKIEDENKRTGLYLMLSIAGKTTSTPMENNVVEGIASLVGLKEKTLISKDKDGNIKEEKLPGKTEAEIVQLLSNLADVALKGGINEKNKEFWARTSLLINDIHKQRLEVAWQNVTELFRPQNKYFKSSELRIYKKLIDAKGDIQDRLDKMSADATKRMRLRSDLKLEPNYLFSKPILISAGIIVVLSIIGYVINRYIDSPLMRFNSLFFFFSFGLLVSFFIYYLLFSSSIKELFNQIKKAGNNADQNLIDKIKELKDDILKQLPLIKNFLYKIDVGKEKQELLDKVLDEKFSKKSLLYSQMVKSISVDGALYTLEKIYNLLKITYLFTSLVVILFTINIAFKSFVFTGAMIFVLAFTLFIGIQVYDILIAVFRRVKFRRSVRVPSLIAFYMLNHLALLTYWMLVDYSWYLLVISLFHLYVGVLLFSSAISTYYLVKDVDNGIVRWFSRMTNNGGKMLLASAIIFGIVLLPLLGVVKTEPGKKLQKTIQYMVEDPTPYPGHITSDSAYLYRFEIDSSKAKDSTIIAIKSYRLKRLEKNQPIYFTGYYTDRVKSDSGENFLSIIIRTDTGYVRLADITQGEPEGNYVQPPPNAQSQVRNDTKTEDSSPGKKISGDVIKEQTLFHNTPINRQYRILTASSQPFELESVSYGWQTYASGTEFIMRNSEPDIVKGTVPNEQFRVVH